MILQTEDSCLQSSVATTWKQLLMFDPGLICRVWYDILLAAFGSAQPSFMQYLVVLLMTVFSCFLSQ